MIEFSASALRQQQLVVALCATGVCLAVALAVRQWQVRDTHKEVAVTRPTYRHTKRRDRVLAVPIEELRDLGSRRKCPPGRAAQREWLEEQKRPPRPLESRVAEAVHRNPGQGDRRPDAADMLQAAWREQRRDPTVALVLADRARKIATHQQLHSRTTFLVGKVLVEAYCDFELGAAYMAHAIEVHPGSWPSRELCAVIFHLSRTLYFGVHYSQSLRVLMHFNSQLLPDAWVGGAAELCMLEETEEGSRHCERISLSDVFASQSELVLTGESEKLDGYHCAMLLHAIVVAAVCRPQMLPSMSKSLRAWLPSRRDELWRQYNAEVRFAVVIDRLVPFTMPKQADHKMYLLGESHILPLAWETADLALGKKSSDKVPYQLVPRLAIGLKAWHFNPDLRDNRERAILLRHSASIPPRSIIVVCAGEIDLRDDGVIAMEPHIWGTKISKYGSSNEAITATVDVFCRGLEILRDCGHTVLVHPVRPVPPSCRGKIELATKLVIGWNHELRKRLAATSRIHYLDFFTDLHCSADLNGSGLCSRCGCTRKDGMLCTSFDIGDGVHTNRAYLPILYRHIERSIQPEPQ